MTLAEKFKASCREHPLKKVFKGYTYGQIASIIGLHPVTISNALNGWSISDETEQKLQDLANELKRETMNAQ